MELKNQNSSYQMTELILLGFRLPRHLEIFLFVFLLFLLLLTFAGNITIITLVCLDHHLQTPMYVFLCNLSLLDMLLFSTTAPKMLVNLISKNKGISFLGCIIQCYFYFFFGASETILISMMAFDRYVAICHPLHYTLIMNGKVCINMIIACWVGPFFTNSAFFFLITQLSFCGGSIIDHFFCDYVSIVKLSCNNVSTLLSLTITVASLGLFVSFFITAISYLYIIVTILRMNAANRKKAFSTCVSHITVASIFYGMSIFLYCLPTEGRSHEVQKSISLFLAVFIPLLNPFIYTLRNERVKETFRDHLRRQKCSR